MKDLDTYQEDFLLEEARERDFERKMDEDICGLCFCPLIDDKCIVCRDR